jgi:hypothetical protein
LQVEIIPSQRDARGRVLPGTSLNPAGKAKGTLSEAGRIRAALSGELPQILAAVVQRAKDGDLQAARIILDRVLPPLRAEAAPVSLAGLDGDAPLTERATLVFKAATAGDITVEAASTLITALSGLSRLREADELAARVARLEARYGA